MARTRRTRIRPDVITTVTFRRIRGQTRMVYTSGSVRSKPSGSAGASTANAISKNGAPLYCHRLALGFHLKAPLGVAHALHACDNPPCCNPAHLKRGTHKQNMEEAAARGLMASGQRNGMSRTSKARRAQS